MKRFAFALALGLLALSCSHKQAAVIALPSPTPTFGPDAFTQTATPRPSLAPISNAAKVSSYTSSPTALPTPTPPPGASVGNCPLFPADNAWRRDVSHDPVDANSRNYITSISQGGAFLHPDFGSNASYGIPYTVVGSGQKKVPIKYTAYGDESDKGPFPIPLNAKRESGSDHHVLVAQKDTCLLFELYNAKRTSTGWAADSGAKFDLRSNALRPAGWTSADAAGLPILPGLVRRDECTAGAINHALRFTAPHTQAGYVDPARHFASSDSDPNLPPMGLRLRLKASFDLAPFHGCSLVVLRTLKTYGMLLADNGSSWFISGATDTGWNDDDMNQLKSVPGSAFEVLQHGTIHT